MKTLPPSSTTSSCSDTGLNSHVHNINTIFERLGNRNLKHSRSKAKLGATGADFLGYAILSSGAPNTEKITAFTRMPMPTNVRHRHSLIGGIEYYRKFVANTSIHLHCVYVVLKQRVKSFSPRLWKPLFGSPSTTSPPIFLVDPDWDTVAKTCHALRLYCDDSRDSFGATRKQEPPAGSLHPIVLNSRATPDN